eukprot:869929_1
MVFISFLWSCSMTYPMRKLTKIAESYDITKHMISQNKTKIISIRSRTSTISGIIINLSISRAYWVVLQSSLKVTEPPDGLKLIRPPFDRRSALGQGQAPSFDRRSAYDHYLNHKDKKKK